MADNTCVVVMDNGSSMSKAGFAGDNTPRTIFPTIVGHPCQQGVDMAGKEFYIGNEAQSKRGVLSLRSPIRIGTITNWDDMEKIWHHTFDELHVTPEEHPTLLTEAPYNSMESRKKMTQIMFETFRTPALHIANKAVLSLHAAGRKTGIVLDSGDSMTYAIPVFEGLILQSGVIHTRLGGRDLDHYLGDILRNHKPVSSSLEHEILRDIKEKLCYVSMDFVDGLAESGSSPAIERTYELPDGQIITFGSERFRIPEALFKPWLAGMESYGIQEMIYNAVNKCDNDIRRALYGNIVLSGGNTMFSGIADRLEKEILSLAPSSMKVNVDASLEGNCSAWMGGSVIASLPDFNDLCISKQEFDESGPAIMYRKWLKV
ncbi:actin 1 [Mortierella sp. GBAus27b]|nr:actin 1 [Mortierella sp. GBAus27b]